MKIKKSTIQDWTQKLINKTRNAGIWQNWRVELRMNEKGEFYLTDFINHATTIYDNSVAVARMSSWDVRTAHNSYWPDYVKEAYETLTQKQVGDVFEVEPLLAVKGVEEMAFERCNENYDDSNILFGMTRGIVDVIREEAKSRNWKIEVV